MSKIKNHEDLIRDPITGVVKNKNRTSFINARARKKEVVKKNQEEYEKDCRICDLEKELKELKKLVSQLVSSDETSSQVEPKPRRTKKNTINDSEV